ncbi:hypothetical protein [Leptolyngbya ohadii]|uniref:hypothetical protein n=1 Tax=Leptolyngbya ohadii TaxID=1962290 RepID=UPI000B59FCC7|nr:hypothetical protein [Leptolyngbya ohadii]
MSQEQRVDLGKLNALNAFLNENAEIDFREADLRHVPSIDKYEWTGFEDEKETLIKQLRIYQLLLWIVPTDRDDLAKKLLENNIVSLAQIVSVPKEVFIQNNIKLFDDNSVLAEQVYIRATSLRSRIVRLQQNHMQQSEKPVSTTSIASEKLNGFLEKNQEIDFRTADLLHNPTVDQYKWVGFEDEKESLINQLKAYQRMLRVVPSDREDLAKKLVESGIQSSLQITSIPKKAFIQDNLTLFDNDSALAEQVYMRALALRKAVALQYVAYVQQVQPHSRTNRFIG